MSDGIDLTARSIPRGAHIQAASSTTNIDFGGPVPSVAQSGAFTAGVQVGAVKFDSGSSATRPSANHPNGENHIELTNFRYGDATTVPEPATVRRSCSSFSAQSRSPARDGTFTRDTSLRGG